MRTESENKSPQKMRKVRTFRDIFIRTPELRRMVVHGRGVRAEFVEAEVGRSKKAAEFDFDGSVRIK